jgi:transposase
MYNRAQTEEKHHFRRLLADLCRELPTTRKLGRPQVPISDMIFAMTYKVYTGFSERRFATDLRELFEAGYISRVPHYNLLSRCFGDPDTEKLLSRLIVASALPLVEVETRFAADGTGFGSLRFLRWYDHRNGVTKEQHIWVRAHIMTGLQTQIVASVQMTKGTAHDAPRFPKLLAQTTENFTVKEVMADKGYSSVRNLEAARDSGAIPYIAFKDNATTEKGGYWEKMLNYYRYRREDYLLHYHQRSNVEAAISAIKRKFGSAVRSRGFVAMKNEVLAKILSHNICCLIGSMFELGIDPQLREQKSPA